MGNAQLAKTDINELIELYNSGQLAVLENRATNLIGQFPNTGLLWKLLGAAQSGQGKDALSTFQNAAALIPNDAEIHLNLGLAFHSHGQKDEAVQSYRNAIQIKQDFVEAHNNLGNVMSESGQLEEAVICYRKALNLVPDNAEISVNLGMALHLLGRNSEAEACFRRAIQLMPDHATALNELAKLLMITGRSAAALDYILQSLEIERRSETKKLFVGCVLNFKPVPASESVKKNMILALSEPWCRPVNLALLTVGLLKQNPIIRECIARAAAAWPRRLADRELYGKDGIQSVADDELLRCLLKSAQNCSLDMERFLTMSRSVLLADVCSKGPTDRIEKNLLIFYSALAQQCFINEFVFACSDSEAEQAGKLRDKLAAELQSDIDVHMLELLAVASYFPLYGLLFHSRLLKRSWPGEIDTLLSQQIREPALERQFGAAMPQLTDIEDEVSLKVQNLYEENPYPRWIKPAPVTEYNTIEAMLVEKFSRLAFPPNGNKGTLDILIAGCGTGQHSIATARHFPSAKVLAIDLSRASLGYAQRKSQELGLVNVEYAQADIMKMGTIEKRFDVIESCGVLHHLSDPWAGWKILLQLLRPGGYMHIGLYSQIARKGIDKAREFIGRMGYGSSADDIRRCRQELLGSDGGASYGTTLRLLDFFTTSECRDLLFHIQEHRLTLDAIKNFLDTNDLEFLGFEVTPDVLQAYFQRFPEDTSATNLDNWQVFENDNPDTFLSMYLFWVRRIC